MSELIPTGMFTKSVDLSQKDGGRTSPLVDSTPPKDGYRPIEYIKQKYNTEWTKIPHPRSNWTRIMEPPYVDKKDQCETETLYYRYMPMHNSYSFTINFDPDIDDYVNCKYWQVTKLTKFFNILKDNGTINRLVFVHEFGKNNKVHFHGVMQFHSMYANKKSREERFVKPCLEWFNVRKNLTHRTLQYYKIKDQQHMDLQYSYMFKELHNRFKCTYYI